MNGKQIRRMSLMTAIAVAASIGVSTHVSATNSIRNAWVAKYPASTSLTNLSSSCNLCHATSGSSNWNAYGWAMRVQIQGGASTNAALTAVESLNSDLDPGGKTNLQEITANTQPGWTPGPNNTYYFTSSTTPGQMPAALVAGAYDPAAPCLADVNGNGVVNIDDLLGVINAWGPCAGCTADVNGNGVVNIDDLLAVINGWGACP